MNEQLSPLQQGKPRRHGFLVLEMATVWDRSPESFGRKEHVHLSYGGAVEGDEAQNS